MGFFDGFAEGLASAVDDIRNEFETAVYGRPTTDAIELPQAEAPDPQPMSSGIIDLTGPDSDGWGGPAEELADLPQAQTTSWAELSDAMQEQGIETPQLDAPEPEPPSVDIDMGD